MLGVLLCHRRTDMIRRIFHLAGLQKLFAYRITQRRFETTMGTFLYFGYGSNLLKERIQLKNPSAVFVDVAELKDYRLCFGELKDGICPRWHGCVATIEQRHQETVWGVVWRLNSEDLPHLDKQEDEGDIYRRILVTVKTASGESLECWSYSLIAFTEGLPSPQYLQVIRRGAQQNRLPEGYRRWLDAIPHNGYSGSVEIMNSIDASAVEDEDTFLYFAYGSNLLKTRLHMQNPTAELVGRAKLEGYRLGFGALPSWGKEELSRWNGSAGYIEECPGSHVWGAVWRIQRSQVGNLDRQEALYYVSEVSVETPEGVQYTCRTYQLDGPQEMLPSPHYMRVIIAGAIQLGIPEAYIDDLKKVPHNGDTNPPDFLDSIL